MPGPVLLACFHLALAQNECEENVPKNLDTTMPEGQTKKVQQFDTYQTKHITQLKPNQNIPETSLHTPLG